jgi:hypothetical protein
MGKKTVRITECGKIVEVVYFSAVNRKSSIVNLSKDEYMVLKTGEVCEKVHKDKRVEQVKSLRRTFRNIRNLVNTNCTVPDNLLWVTLTYAENMIDPEQLYSDYKAFIQRVYRQYGKLEYICVVEPQARGALHCHVVFIFPSKAPFIPNKHLALLWGQGFVKINRVKDVDNLGAYLSAYLADVEVSVGNPEAELKEVDGTTKAFIKGARLKLYPSGMNIFRCSRGIKKPVISWVDDCKAEMMVYGLEMTYQSEKTVQLDDGYTFTAITECYRR